MCEPCTSSRHPIPYLYCGSSRHTADGRWGAGGKRVEPSDSTAKLYFCHGKSHSSFQHLFRLQRRSIAVRLASQSVLHLSRGGPRPSRPIDGRWKVAHPLLQMVDGKTRENLLDLGKRWYFIVSFLVRYANELVVTEIIPAEIPLGLDTVIDKKHGRYGWEPGTGVKSR